MKYKAYIHQEGEGCDYTIACGKKVIDLEANSISEAGRELCKIIKEEYSNDERRLESAEIFEIASIAEVNVKEIYSGIYDEGNAMRAKAQERSEKEEYERLKAKFGS